MNKTAEDKFIQEFMIKKEQYILMRQKAAMNIVAFIREYINEKNDVAFVLPKCPLRQGRATYTSNNYISPHDLRMWKWICVEINNVNFYVFLQCFEKDQKTQNMHVLMDRIGVYAYVGEYSAEDAFDKMIITDFELPLTTEQMRQLIMMLITLSKCEKFKIQAEFQSACKNVK